jgi:bifunctional non-homologous end joining protein LigD
MDKQMEINGHTLELSSLDKVLYPDAQYTKADIIDYYRRMAETMLPHMRGRPLTLHRFPDGIGKSGFYQKEARDYFPEWINRVTVDVLEEKGTQEQITCEDAATLVYLANQACLTPHIWLSCVEHLDQPDKLIFDLDPPDDDFAIVRKTAFLLRQVLEEIGLAPFLMTTGSRGLHIVVPLAANDDFDAVRTFAHRVARLASERDPDNVTVAQRKNKRKGRLFVDYLRNAYGQNSVAPYSLRAKPGAPVATPLDWHELRDDDLDSQTYTMANIFRRLGQKEDPWRDFTEKACKLDDARQQVDKLLETEDDS